MLIRLLSINIWDLPISFPGFDRRRRFGHLLAGLPALDADLVLIQESFRVSLRKRIHAVLPRHNAQEGAERRVLRLPLLPNDRSGGLFTLSRWPVTRTRMQRWRHKHWLKVDEQLARKGALFTELSTPVGPLLLCNVHLHAGLASADARARVLQLREFLAQPEAARNGPMIVAGDLNIDAAHEPAAVSPNGFDLLREAGFQEIAGGSNDGLGTFVPAQNRYARVGLPRPDHRRLTHVFCRGANLRALAPPTICFDNPPVSDHFGLLATLELS
jgi:endonuclease/exonuclease/phosphatase family metal-dependent hydrolase